MKKSLIIVVLIIIAAATGCDFLRSIGGRPTSEDLEAARTELAFREEARRQERLDSIRKVEERQRDSMAALDAKILDSLDHKKGSTMRPEKLGGLKRQEMSSRYGIVVGAFRNMPYAEKKIAKCIEAGYPAQLLSFGNGLDAVVICQSDNLSATVAAMKEAKAKGVCPKDGWILVNE